MESRIRREVSVRFGRGKVETYRSNPARRNQPTSSSCLICSAKRRTMCMAAGFQSMCAVSLMKPPISGRFLVWKSWWPPSEAVRSPPVWCCRRRVSSRRFIRTTPIPLSETWILPSSWAVKSRLPSKSWLPCWARKQSTPCAQIGR